MLFILTSNGGTNWVSEIEPIEKLFLSMKVANLHLALRIILLAWSLGLMSSCSKESNRVGELHVSSDGSLRVFYLYDGIALVAERDRNVARVARSIWAGSPDYIEQTGDRQKEVILDTVTRLGRLKVDEGEVIIGVVASLEGFRHFVLNASGVKMLDSIDRVSIELYGRSQRIDTTKMTEPNAFIDEQMQGKR